MNTPPMRMVERRAAPPQIHCHKMIRSAAIEMAAEIYAKIMGGDNELYAQWKKICPELNPVMLEIRMIEMLWPKLIPEARATLARLLTTTMAEDLKEEIADALVADATLRRVTSGRRAPQRG